MLKINVHSLKNYYNILKIISMIALLVLPISCSKNTSIYNVLILNGGKDIERASFLDIFENISNISTTTGSK